MSKERLSIVDTAWLRMEDPTNLMMITGIMVFSTKLDVDRLKATLEQRLLCFDRFRQRVVHSRLPTRGFYWQDDPGLDINEHVVRITLPPPGDQSVLQEVVSTLMSTQLGFSKPLWELHVIEHYGEGSALIARLHHSIGDGISLVRVLLSMTDADPDAPWPELTAREKPPTGRSALGTLCQPARSMVRTAAHVTETILRETRETLTHPSAIVDAARLGTSSATAFARLVLMWPDPDTRFKGRLNVPKRAAWSDPIPLSAVKAAGRIIGGTINDVLLTAMTGALRRYLLENGDEVDSLSFRAVVPVNLRPLDEELTLGNKFGLVFLPLPVGIGDPIERLRELKLRMDKLKGTPEAVVAFGILNAIGLMPTDVQNGVVNLFGKKGTAVMTNVPGPRETIYLAGAPLDTIMFWVPQSGRLGLGVSIISYAGQVRLGVASDEKLVPDPETIVGAFHTEFDELLELTAQMEKTTARTARIAEMAAILQDAIDKLNAMTAEINATPEPPVGARGTTPERCQALTKAGRQCKNRALNGGSCCRTHHTQEDPVPQ